MPPLEPPAHIQQVAPGYCLPACGQMALAQFGIKVTQADLVRALGTRAGVGTPFSRVERLTRWNTHVQLTQHGSLDDLAAAQAADMVIIVALTTTPGLPGWGNISTQHTVLIINVSVDRITYQDPALSYGPVSASCAEFLLAWNGMDERAAFLSLL